MTEFTKRIIFSPAYDKRDPDPKKNYGIHGVEFSFVLRGPEGAVSFKLSTGWLLPETLGVPEDESAIGMGAISYSKLLHEQGFSAMSPMPVDLGFHSLARPSHWDSDFYGEEPTFESCEYLDGQPCHYDGSTLNAWRPFVALLRGGDEGCWSYLEDYYQGVFGHE